MAYCPNDVRLGRQTLCSGVLVWPALALVLSLSAERAIPAPTRYLSMLMATGPVAAGLAMGWVLWRSKKRGEPATLAQVGVGPLRAALGAAIGAWLLGCVAIIGWLLVRADSAVLFAAPLGLAEWRVCGRGAFVEALSGVSLQADGWPRLGTGGVARLASIPTSTELRMAAVWLMLPLAAVIPFWIAIPSSRLQRILTVSFTIVLGAIETQWVAAGRLASGWLMGASIPLAVSLLASLDLRQRKGVRPGRKVKRNSAEH